MSQSAVSSVTQMESAPPQTTPQASRPKRLEARLVAGTASVVSPVDASDAAYGLVVGKTRTGGHFN